MPNLRAAHTNSLVCLLTWLNQLLAIYNISMLTLSFLPIIPIPLLFFSSLYAWRRTTIDTDIEHSGRPFVRGTSTTSIRLIRTNTFTPSIP
ncbi:hypothetical protein I7I50_10442 [Histoplasma capsulatum G186AR]|uniref:Uncharacterized protein n=1 Tax=Ajellomyces capsulatus TaxID=5037 RepID=A0A8H7Z9C5_AJECA|nr:hypothetical protein I7I52_01681 [Histoplasma capsulatum]QSS69227.1 hypothetical protein I7I50_10442 [Histoplasma capsulatum G186AR]